MVQVITSKKAPDAIGPYSQAIATNGFIYTSGQIALNPDSGNLIEGSIKEQTRQVLENLTAVLESAGSNLNKVVKTTVFMQDLAQFADMNEVYAEYFSSHKPARSTVQVAKLPRNAMVEIEAVALQS